MTIRFSVGWKAIGAGVVVLIVVFGGAWQGMEFYTSQSSFCGGTCHIMSEPYEAWKASKHFAANSATGAQAECIECHFLPGGKRTLEAKYIGLRHLAAYLFDPDAHLPVRPVVKDGACLRSGCHATEKFQDKEIKYTERTVFRHKGHFEKETLAGQKLFCETCHVKHSAKKHFETPKEICFVCHFAPGTPGGDEQNAGQPILITAAPDPGTTPDQQASANPGAVFGFNRGANKCSLCHVIPTKSLQQQKTAEDESKKPITHETLEKAGVPCESCHLHQVAGAASIKTDECLDCHSASPTLYAKGKDARLMHDEHVAGRRADCLECHQPVGHGARKDYLEPVRADCVQCHSDPHRFQMILVAGARVSENVSPIPGLMDAVATNCIGCHTKPAHSGGQPVMSGSGEACAACHTPDHRKMLQDWKDLLGREIRALKEVEEEAEQALEDALGRATQDRLEEAREMIAEGRRILAVIEYGNGVHNKKYAITLIDEVYANFEDTIDLLESQE